MSVRTDMDPFVMIPCWLIKHPSVSPTAIRLFGVLHSHDGEQGCFPSRKTLARDMHCSPATVDRAIEELEAVGAVAVTARHRDDHMQTSNAFVLHFRAPNEAIGEVDGVLMDEEGGDHQCIGGVITSDDPGYSPVMTQELDLLNKIKRTRGGALAPTRPVSLFEDEDGQPRHKPITERWLVEQQALNPDLDVRSVYEDVRNLKRWDGYKDKRRGLRKEFEYVRERRQRFSGEREATEVEVQVDNYAPRQGMLG